VAMLDLSGAPNDPVEAIIWLDGVMERARHELDLAYEQVYFDARLQGRLDEAVSVGRASRKRALAWTRRRNERLGRTVRWGDQADPSSGAYRS
jgi:hypothetical protein